MINHDWRRFPTGKRELESDRAGAVSEGLPLDAQHAQQGQMQVRDWRRARQFEMTAAGQFAAGASNEEGRERVVLWRSLLDMFEP